MRKAMLLSTTLLVAVAVQPAHADDEMRARLDRLEREYVRLLIEDRRKTQELERLRAQVEGRPVEAVADGHDHGSHHAGHAEAKGHEGHGHDDHGLPDVLISRNGVTLYTPSIAIDTALYRDDGDEPLEERLEGLRGFGHAHGDDHDHGGEDGHAHSVLEDGFNLRHAELGIAAGVDGFGRAQILLNGSEDGVELEEAYIQTERFADVIDFRVGQFASGYGFTNALHIPERDFADRELASQVLFGDHGLEGLGARTTIAPSGTPFELGFEVFNGGEETLFSHEDGAGDVDKPGVLIGWLKGDVPLAQGHRLSLGLAGGFGAHQEAHEHEDEDHHDDDDHDHDDDHAEMDDHDDDHDDDHGEEEMELLDGDAWFIAPSLAYHFDGGGERGAGDLRIDAEYIYRVKDLDIVGEAGGFEAKQDGITIGATYGVAPGLRVGARYEHIGLTNSVTEGGAREDFDDSWRVSGLVSYDINDFARVGAQANYGEYDFAEGRDEVLQVLGRLTVQLGPHLH